MCDILETIDGRKVLIDDTDHQWAREFAWMYNGRVFRRNSQGQPVLLDREILVKRGLDILGLSVFHRNEDLLDNRFANLATKPGTLAA